MNILYIITVFIFSSSLLMVSYVWFNYLKHKHSAGYGQEAESNNFSQENHYNEEILAA